MNTNGKKMRQSMGLNRYEIKFNEHSCKSAEKRNRMSWGPKGQRQAMKAGKFSQLD
jgi:hypothetical protein